MSFVYSKYPLMSEYIPYSQQKNLKWPPLAIKEMQIKTILIYNLTPLRMAKIKNTMITYAGEDVK